MFDDGDEDRHCGVLLAPVLKRLIRDQSTRIFKRDVDVKTGKIVDVFNDWHARLCDDSHGAVFYVLGLFKGVGGAVEIVIRGVAREACAAVGVGYNDQVHVGVGEEEVSGEGAEGADVGVGPEGGDGCADAAEEVKAYGVFVGFGLDVGGEVDDFFMEPGECQWSTNSPGNVATNQFIMSTL